MKILIVAPNLPSPAVEMRGVRSNGPFPRLLERGAELRAVVPVSRRVPTSRVPLVETDCGVEIAHPRALGVGRWSKWTWADRLERRSFARAVTPELDRFLASGGEILHAHSSWLPGAALAGVSSAKVVLSMHDQELLETLPAVPKRRARTAQLLRRADAVVYVSEMLRRAGENVAGPHRSCVIPYGVDEYPDIESHPADVFTIVTAARLIERKKVHDLVEAFALVVADTGPANSGPAKLVIVGDGPERDRLEQLVTERGVKASVEFTGALTNRQVAGRIAGAHVFVLPSVREALGTVYFEAMARQVPVIGTRGEGIAEHVTDGIDGFLVEPGDVRALAAILGRLRADDSWRRAVGERGAAVFTRSGVRWADHADAHLELFERLLFGGAP